MDNLDAHAEVIKADGDTVWITFWVQKVINSTRVTSSSDWTNRPKLGSSEQSFKREHPDKGMLSLFFVGRKFVSLFRALPTRPKPEPP